MDVRHVHGTRVNCYYKYSCYQGTFEALIPSRSFSTNLSTNLSTTLTASLATDIIVVIGQVNALASSPSSLCVTSLSLSFLVILFVTYSIIALNLDDHE